jgi:protein involved in polysaccharide export with SLBB domain
MISNLSPLGRLTPAVGLAFLVLVLAGCRPFDFYDNSLSGPSPKAISPPRELSKTSLPAYRIEPPDVLLLEMQKMVPLPPYRLETFDMLQVNVFGTLAEHPIMGLYLVDGEGTIDLGPGYGKIRIAGMTVEETGQAIDAHLRQILKLPEVSVQLARAANVQPVNGMYVVASDGTINLRQYGSVFVAGKTIIEARLAVEKHLTQFFDSPALSLEVTGYNSKVYYVITEGVGDDDSVVRIPCTGNETVLDAMSQVHGISGVSSRRIWIARPAPYGFHCEQILPVDWVAITRGGAPATNYQLLPGDRLFIAHDESTALTAYIGKIMSPIERVIAFGSMGSSTIREWQTLGRGYNQNRLNNTGL